MFRRNAIARYSKAETVSSSNTYANENKRRLSRQRSYTHLKAFSCFLFLYFARRFYEHQQNTERFEKQFEQQFEQVLQHAPGSTSPGYIRRPSTENNVEVEVKTQTQTQILTQLAPTLSSQLVSPATECMLRLEEKYIPLMYEWSAALLPILYSVKILDDVYYVIFNTFDLPNHSRKWLSGTYSCNGIEGGKILPSWLAGRGNLIVECPHSIQASNSEHALVSVSATPSGSDGKANITKTVTYDTVLFEECERKDIRYFSNNNNVDKKIKMGVQTSAKGDRDMTLVWAVYHHLIGFDHIWIYVNEDWNNATDLVHRDYITWIPFRFNIAEEDLYNITRKDHGYYPTEIMRVSAQNDALWRAKRMGLDWLALIDADEYIQLVTPKSDNMAPFNKSLTAFGGNMNGSGSGSPPVVTKALSASDIDSVSKYFDTFRNTIGDEYVAIELAPVSFGSNFKMERRNPPKKLVMDYVWRENIDVDDIKHERFKLIVNVTSVWSVKIHYVGGSDINRTFKPPKSEFRFNHFKVPTKGVFNNRHNWMKSWDVNETIKDTLFADEHREKLVEELNRDVPSATS